MDIPDPPPNLSSHHQKPLLRGHGSPDEGVKHIRRTWAFGTATRRGSTAKMPTSRDDDEEEELLLLLLLLAVVRRRRHRRRRRHMRICRRIARPPMEYPRND